MADFMSSSFTNRDMEYFSILEKKKTYNILKWKDKLQETIEDRGSHWNEPAEIGWKIKSNDLPIGKTLSSMPNYTGEFFIDNKIKQGNKWKTSTILSGDIEIDVTSASGIENEQSQLLENELNRIFYQGNFQKKLKYPVEDANYTGVGVVRMWWDAFDIDSQWLTGKPKMEYIDSRYIWYYSPDNDVENIESIWQYKRVDIDTLNTIYPDYVKKHGEIEADDWTEEGLPNSDNRYSATIVINQYSKVNILTKYEIIDKVSGESHVVTKLDIDKAKEDLINSYRMFLINGSVEIPYAVDYIKDFIRNTGSNLTNIPTIEQFIEYMSTNGIYPEEFYESKPINIRQVVWYEVKYLATNNIILEEPIAVGYQSDYKILLLGERQTDSIYPLSTTYDLYPMQEQSIILMTIATIMAAKYNKPTPVIEEGALNNEEEFRNNYWKLGHVPEINANWRMQHPGQDPIKWELPPQNVQLPVLLHNMTMDSIKTSSGAIDEARGQQSYSGQSGISIGRLQTASKSYIQIDIESFRDFVTEIIYWLKDSIVRYKTYPFKVDMPSITDESGTERVDVNTNSDNTLENDNYICKVNITVSPEDVKFAETQTAVNLFQMGLMSKLDTLYKVDVKNPMRVYQNKIEEDEITQLGIMVQEIAEKNPEIIQQLQALAQQNTNNSGTTQ
jgi:hypothetical protein